jgi:hypothetical protein
MAAWTLIPELSRLLRVHNQSDDWAACALYFDTRTVWKVSIGRVLGVVTRETWALANALTLTVVDSRVISRSCPQMYF